MAERVRAQRRALLSEGRPEGATAVASDRELDREQLLDRLRNLRTIVPVFAQELSSARRQVTRLRVENGTLLEQVRLLQRQRADIDGRPRGRSVRGRAARHEVSVR